MAEASISRFALCAAGVALGVLSVTCADRVVPRPHTASPHTLDVPDASSSVDAGALTLRNEPFEALLAERDALMDWRHTALFQGPQPDRLHRPIQAFGSFPAAAVASARAYTFGYVQTFGCNARSGATDRVEEYPFAKDGALCANAVAPGADLSADQWHRALGLIAEAERSEREVRVSKSPRTSRPRSRCGFDPHHAIVFYDREGAAIAKLLVCFTCSEWIATPQSTALGGSGPAGMSGKEAEVLAAVFEELHLGAWMVRGEMAAPVRAYEKSVYGTPRELTDAGKKRLAERRIEPSGVLKGREARSLNREERLRMCVAFYEELRARGQQGGMGYECQDKGHAWSTADSTAACANPPLACEATVARIEACMGAFVNMDEVCSEKHGGRWPAVCDGVLGCLPGITVH
jgi:hypothetical protein